MDIFDHKNNFIGSTPATKGGFIKDYIKDIVFLQTIKKGYKYYQKYSNIYAMSANKANIISLFDVFLDNDKNLRDEKYTKDLYNNLKNDFKLKKEDYYDALELYFNPSSKQSIKILGKIYDTVFDTELRVNTRVMHFDDILELPEPKIKCDTNSDPTCNWSAENSPTSSVSSFEFDNEEEQKIEDETLSKLNQEEFLTKIVSYEIIEKNDVMVNVYYLYSKIETSNYLLSTGIVLEGKSEFKYLETKDKSLKKYLREFINSEHVKETKYLKPETFHFLYKIPNGVIRGEIDQKGQLKLKIKQENLYYEFLSTELEKVNLSIDEIYKIIDINRTNTNLKPYVLNLKIIYPKGYTSLENVSKFYKGKVDRNTFVRFNLPLKEGYIKNVIYTKTQELANFILYGVKKDQVKEILSNFRYFIDNVEIIENSKKPVIKKEAIKSLKSLNIQTDSRECPKDRRPSVLSDQDQRESILVEGVNLGCNENYPYPGFTKKNNIPCCFKKPQKNKQIFINKTQNNTQEPSCINKNLILSKRPLAKDDVSLETYQRGRLSNKILKNIFRNHYSLSSGVASNLNQTLKFIYCEDIIQKSIENLTQEDHIKYGVSSLDFKEWLSLKNKPIDTILKACCIYKKINIITVKEEEDGTLIDCSMTNLFENPKYVVLISKMENYRTLVDDDLNFEFDKNSSGIEELEKLVISYCKSVSCQYKIYNLGELLQDTDIDISHQIKNSENKIVYIETRNYGVLPILPSIVQNLSIKEIRDLNILQDSDQYSKLLEISKKYQYLEPVKMILSPDGNIKGIELYCGLVSPVKIEKPSINLPVSELNFYIDLENALSDKELSGEELKLKMEDLENEYVKQGKEIIFNNIAIDNYEEFKRNIENQNYEDIIKSVIELTIKDDKSEIEISIPFKINSEIYNDVISRISWSFINNDF